MNQDPSLRILLDRASSADERRRMKNELADDDSTLSQELGSLNPDDVETALRTLHARQTPPDMDPLSKTETDALFLRIQHGTRARRRWSLRSLAIGACAGAALASGVFVVTPVSTSREKGAAALTAPHVQLVFHVGRNEPHRPLVVERGTPGARYASGTDILLRYQIATPGAVCLAHQAPGEPLKALAQDVHREPGIYALRKEGRAQALRLTDAPGQHRFFVVWTERPTSCPAVVDDVAAGRQTDAVADSLEVEIAQ